MTTRNCRTGWLAVACLPLLGACTGEIGGGVPSSARPQGGATAGAGGAASTPSATPGNELPGGPGTDCAQVAPAPDQPRRLNRTELNHLAVDTLGVDGEPFARLVNDRNAKVNASLAVATGFVDDYEASVQAVAAAFVAKHYPAGSCVGEQAASCAFAVLSPFLDRLERRPVSDARRARLQALIGSGLSLGLPVEEALAGTLAAVLLSPATLFVGTHVSATPGVQALDPFGVAERLALAIWSSVPDAELLAAAAADQLRPGAGLEQQIDRMLTIPVFGQRFLPSLVESYLHVSTLDAVGGAEPPAGVAAASWPQLTSAMARETSSFMAHLFEADIGISDMLDGRYTFLDKGLAAHYGIAVPPTLGDVMQRVDLPLESPFQGLLTHGALTVPTHKDGVPEIFRGKEVNYLFACVELPVPESAALQDQINAQLSDTTSTQAQKYELRNGSASCLGCHQRMDPLGKAFNAFDPAGRFDPTVTDTSSTYDGVALAGPRDVAALLKTKDFASCVSSYVLGPMVHQALNIADANGWCAVQPLLAKAGPNPGLRSLVKAALASDAVRRRVVAPE